MDQPEKIPLEEAVARGLIPCSLCGVKGAAVREGEGGRQFVCDKCVAMERAARWKWAFAGVALAAALAAAVWFFVREGRGTAEGEGDLSSDQMGRLLRQAERLQEQGKFRDALQQLQGPFRENPRNPMLNLLVARSLRKLGYHELAIPIWRALHEGPPDLRAECAFSAGEGYLRMARAAEALPWLETPFPPSAFERERTVRLAEAYADLERYEDALTALEGRPLDASVFHARYRSLAALGRHDEARALLEGLSEHAGARAVIAVLRASTLREAGDFAGALKSLEEAGDLPRAKRARLAVHLEAGDVERLRAGAAALAAEAEDAQFRAEALWYAMIGHLLAGDRDAARAAAREFLARTDPALTALRLERIMMRHLLEELKEAEVEAEARVCARVWANEIYYYLALATGKRAWAERARDATPGRNFPYHAIQRLLR